MGFMLNLCRIRHKKPRNAGLWFVLTDPNGLTAGLAVTRLSFAWRDPRADHFGGRIKLHSLE